MNCERFPGAAQDAMLRCRPGIVTRKEFAKVPDQRCTAIALHSVREKRGSLQCIRQ
jgi:hypothetical protein